MRDRRGQILADMLPDIDADQINQPEGCRPGTSHERTGDGVHFIDGIAILDDVIQRKSTCPKSDTIADEVGRVLA